MLIIGDAATRKFNPNHKIRRVEVVYHDYEELDFILRKYGLTKATHQNLHTQTFKKNGLEYTLYAKKMDMIFGTIMKQCMDRKMRLTYASPFYNFIIDSVRVVNYHGKFRDWLSRIESYTFLANNYVADLVEYDDKFNDWITKIHNLLKNFKLNQRQVAIRPYHYRKYTVATRKELLQVVCTVFLNNSPLYKLWGRDGESNGLDEKKFDAMRYNEQVEACIESLYVDVLNEFVIPFIQETKMQPEDEAIEDAFYKAIMHRASQRKDAWFGHFMINNYHEITDCYHKSFYSCFKNTLRAGEIVVS